MRSFSFLRCTWLLALRIVRLFWFSLSLALVCGSCRRLPVSGFRVRVSVLAFRAGLSGLLPSVCFSARSSGQPLYARSRARWRVYCSVL